MKNYYIHFLFLLIAGNCLAQTTYYVSEAGNATNDGKSTAATWSFAKINSSMNVLQAGDNVLFKRGDTFRGKLFITTTAATQANKITFGAYGTGSNPVIKGSNVVSGWTASGQPNIWYATYSQPVEHVYKNGQLLTVARYPNAGVLTATATGTTTSFTDNALGQPADYFKDATVHMRTIDWQWEKRVVSSSSATGVVYGPTPTQYPIKNGWGYYFDNKLSFLDAPNEWFYEASSNRLYLYSATNPAADLFEAPAINHGISTENLRKNIVIQDFDVRHNTGIGIFLNESQFCTITRCKVSQMLNRGMLTFGNSSNNTITYNVVEDILGTGIEWSGENETITHNTVRRIGLIPGYGTTDFGDYGLIAGKSCYVAYNVVEDIAHGGIGLSGMGTIAEFNTINNPCLVMNDCGGMSMAWGIDGGINATLRHNIITNVKGGTFGAPANNNPIGNGIYYGGKDNVNVTTFNNTVANCNGIGISMLDTKDSFALNNTIYNCNSGIANMDLELPAYPINNNTITGNVIYGLNDKQLLYFFKNEQGTLVPNNYNISENNYLHNPYSDVIFKTQVKINGGFPTIDYTLNRLKAERQHDLNSKESFVKLTGFKAATATSANLIANGNFDANLNGWGSNQNYNSIFVRDPSREGMTGGSLKFRNNQDQYTQPLVAFTIANNTVAQWYRLKFSIIGDAPAIIRVSISNNNSPFNGLTAEKPFAINTTVSSHEYFFQLPAGAINARAGFRIANETSAVYTNWLDNVVIEAVNATPDIAPELRSPIFINKTNANATVSLQGKTYRDLDGNYVCGDAINIAPFSSRILVLEDEAAEIAISTTANLPVQNIAGVSQCKWFHADNAALRLASINPQGNDLQNVGVQAFLDNTIRTISGKRALGRNWTVSATGTAGSPAKIRLYFTQAEFDALNAASPLISTVNDLVLTAYAGTAPDNIWCNNVGGTMTRIPATFTAYQNGYYAEFASSNVNAEFWLSENFAAAPLSDTVPTFDPIGPVCAGAALAPLPTISKNNIEGSWSPALNNMATTTYTFTPFYGSCSATAAMTITVGGTTTWNGASWSNGLPDASKSVVISGNFTAAADLNACSLSVTGSAAVNVPSGFTFTVANEVNVANTASLTFQNNANLVQVADVANTGSITVLRNSAPIVRLDHTLWSSPVAGQNLFAFSPNTLPNRFYVYNTATGSYATTGLSASSAFVPGRGYAVRAPNNFPASPAAPWTGTFKGVPNNGNVSSALSTAFEGHNLVGNPYPSAVSAASFVDDAGNMSKIDGTLYFYAHSLPMDANGQFPAGTNYATWNKTGHTLATNSAVVPNGTIQVGQGFIVKAIQAGNANFTNAMRTGNTAGQFFRTAGAAASEAEKHRIWLDLSDGQGSVLSQILVGYVAGATPGFDRGYDGAAFGNAGSSIATKIGDADYAIQARPLPFDASDAVPVAFKAAAAGNYAIALSGMDGLFLGDQDVYLKDNTAGTIHNLKSGAYAFHSPEGTFGSRFEVVYQSSLGTSEPGLVSSSIIAFKKAGVLHVEAKNIEMASIKIYDVQGRLVYAKSGINASSAALPDLQVQNQVVLLQVTSSEGMTAAIKVIL